MKNWYIKKNFFYDFKNVDLKEEQTQFVLSAIESPSHKKIERIQGIYRYLPRRFIRLKNKNLLNFSIKSVHESQSQINGEI